MVESRKRFTTAFLLRHAQKDKAMKHRTLARICLALLLSAFVGFTSLTLQTTDAQPEQIAVNWNS